MDKLRWGILGVARINRRLIPALHAAPSTELRAIASRSPEKAREAATAASIPVAHGSYEALLADPSIDAVYIPLPNTLHAEWVRRAADSGKHVLCEKPLTPTADEAETLVAHCRERGVTLMDGFMWPHHARTTRIRKLMDEGAIGAVRLVRGSFTFPMRPLDPANIRLRPELAGGSLLDVGCYPVYGIRWAFGAEPVSVRALARFEYGVDVEMSGLLEVPGGTVGSFDCGFGLPYRTALEIVGTEGTITIPRMWTPEAGRATFLLQHDDEAEEFAVEGQDQIVCMVEHFSRAVLEGRPVTPSPDEAVRTLRVLDALARSARAGGTVVKV